MENTLETKLSDLLELWKTKHDLGVITEEQLNKLTANFKETIADPLAGLTEELKVQNEQNKIIKVANEIIHSKNSYKLFLDEKQKTATEDEQRALGFGIMVKDLYNRFTGKIDDAGANRLKSFNDFQKNTLQNETTSSAGGILVPTPTLGMIMDDLRESGLFFSETTMYNLSGKDATIPTLTTHATPTVVAEGVAKAVSNLVFGSATLTLKKYACLIPFTDELIQDSIIDLEQVVRNLASEWFGTVTDNILFTGDTAINGLEDLTTTFVTTSATNNQSVTIDNIISAIGGMRSVDLKNAGFYMSPSVWANLHTKKGSSNDHYYLSPDEIKNMTLMGFPVKLTDSLPASSAGASSGQKFIVFGNLKKVIVGVKNGMIIDIATSNVASYDDSGVVSAFQNNLTVIRLEKRLGMVVPFPLRIVQIKTA